MKTSAVAGGLLLCILSAAQGAAAQYPIYSPKALEVEKVETSTNQEGDPDRPIIEGSVPNTESADEDHQDQIDVTSVSPAESGPETEDIGASGSAGENTKKDTKGGNVEAEFKVEEGEKSTTPGERINRPDFGTGAQKSAPSGAQVSPSQAKVIIMYASGEGEEETADTEGAARIQADAVLHEITKNELIERLKKDEGIEIEEKSGAESKAGKPKEIVVVGSKVRESLREIGGRGAARISKESAGGISSADDLALHAAAIASNDENIAEVEVNQEEVSLTYTTPGKLFWFISVNIEQEVAIDDEGRVKVKLPWWAFLSSEEVRFTAAEFETEMESLGAGERVAHAELQYTHERQAQILALLSDLLKSKYDAAVGAGAGVGN